MRYELRGFEGPQTPGEAEERVEPEELPGLAKEAGFELSDEQLEAMSGVKYDWGCWEKVQCVDVCSKYDAEWMHECWRHKKPQDPVDRAIH